MKLVFTEDHGEESAGLVYEMDDGTFAVYEIPLYGGEEFQIAKGKIEVGESELETAIRESGEELGLRRENILSTFYCGKFLGRTHIFASIVKSKEAFNDFDDETGAVAWMSPEEFDRVGRDIHKDVVKCAIDEIHSHHAAG